MLLPGDLAGMVVLEDLGKAYAQHIRESIMRVLCDELKDLLEGGDVKLGEAF